MNPEQIEQTRERLAERHGPWTTDIYLSHSIRTGRTRARKPLTILDRIRLHVKARLTGR